MNNQVGIRFIGLWTALAASGFAATPARALHVRELPSATVVNQQVIIGRAVCAGAAWLLTDVPELTRISLENQAVSSVSIRGLRKGDKLWGLACLAPAELWTLAAHNAIARISADGQIVERLPLGRPAISIYSGGTRILLHQPPAGAGRPLLTTGVPADLLGFSDWPAPVAQRSQTRAEELTTNFVKCGVGAAGYVPCWLVNQSRLSISDGSRAHTAWHDVPFVRTAATDDAVPIWDVALAGSSRMWVLASTHAAPDGRRVGGRLTKSSRRGGNEGFVDVSPGARLILWAHDDRCVLLSSNGLLLEVSEP